MQDAITRADASYALDLVKAICTQVGPGKPGSPQERQRAEMLKKELEAHLGSGNVAQEEFTLAPEAFLGSLPLSALLILGGALANISIGRAPGLPAWATALAALVFSILAVLLLFCEYIQYFELVEPLFKKKQSINVIGALRGPETHPASRLLLISGHHDSALENTWIGALGYGLYVTVPTIFFGILTLAVLSSLQLVGAITHTDSLVQMGTLGWPWLVYPVGPAVIFGLFFNRGRKNGGTVPGAADNLSGSAVAAAMCRFLVKNPSHIPPGIEIRFISFGGEEAGLRGSRRYVERHLEELKRLDARLLNFETVAYPLITILTSDVRGVKHSPAMVNSLVDAAERAGVPYQVKPQPTGAGGSDAGSFSLAGLQAATLLPFQVPQQLVAFYHQKTDAPEVLTLEPLFNVLKLTFEWVRCGGE